MAARFCSSQSVALDLVKARQRKDSRLQLFLQVRPPPPTRSRRPDTQPSRAGLAKPGAHQGAPAPALGSPPCPCPLQKHCAQSAQTTAHKRPDEPSAGLARPLVPVPIDTLLPV